MSHVSQKVGRVARRIRAVAHLDYYVKVEDTLLGDARQGMAYRKDGRAWVAITEPLVFELTDDELAWLIAHEFGHLKLMHVEKEKRQQESEAEEWKKILRESHRSRKAKGHGFLRRSIGTATRSLLAGAVANLSDRQQSREHEEEADKWACETTKKAGYDPAAGATLLIKLHQGIIPQASVKAFFLSTHPIVETRIKRIVLIAESLL